MAFNRHHNNFRQGHAELELGTAKGYAFDQGSIADRKFYCGIHVEDYQVQFVLVYTEYAGVNKILGQFKLKKQP